MGKFRDLSDFERRFQTMDVSELKDWKAYWTQHAQLLAPKVRRQAMKRVHRIDKAIRQRLSEEQDSISNLVPHPRFGRRPRITGLNPETDCGGETFLHWHSPPAVRIPNTAIAADLSKQTAATVPVTHYFDVKRDCVDCGKPFLFFAEEQKHWYEELGFGLESDCVRCVPCRKKQQGLGRYRHRYEELFHVADRTTEQSLEMAECCLALIEASVFHRRQLERVKMLLRRAGAASEARQEQTLAELRARLEAAEREG